MLTDLVLDTNVLLHADDPREPRQADAASLVQKLLASQTALAVDEGFNLDEARNRSLIGAEYLARLTPTSIGFQLVVQLALNGRVLVVSRSVSQAIRKTINQMLRNKRDRTFVAVAYNSDEQTLCSHDYVDFSKTKRGDFEKKLGVLICDAAEADRCL